MRVVFADAGYWIALWRPGDDKHEQAKFLRQLLGGTPIVTTQLVLAEALANMGSAGEYYRRSAVQLVRELRATPNVEIVEQSGAQFWAAFELYAARQDQTWSLTDCASFILMRERGITDALAYDHDFEQAGFVALLRDE